MGKFLDIKQFDVSGIDFYLNAAQVIFRLANETRNVAISVLSRIDFNIGFAPEVQECTRTIPKTY